MGDGCWVECIAGTVFKGTGLGVRNRKCSGSPKIFHWWVHRLWLDQGLPLDVTPVDTATNGGAKYII